MEFLRFGSSIPGSYWGCCAVCIIQNFKMDPDAKASIQLVSGDGGGPISNGLFAGPTYRDIFWQRLRIGTFSNRDMPNHAFLAVLTESQIRGSWGHAWLAILKEAGFEFVRTVCNSVYSGERLSDKPGDQSQNHIFGLFRNIGQGSIADPFTPPKQWTDLPGTKSEAWMDIGGNMENQGRFELANLQRTQDRAIWDSHVPKPFLTKAQVIKAGAPVILAGLRSKFPQQDEAARKAAHGPSEASAADPFASAAKQAS